MKVASGISKSEEQKELFTPEILKGYETAKTSRGTTINEILSASIANPYEASVIFIEGTESFKMFHNLYTHALKKVSQNQFNLDTFNYGLSKPILDDLNLPEIPEEFIGKVIEVSRNLEEIPFPGFMSSDHRAKLANMLIELFNSWEVI